MTVRRVTPDEAAELLEQGWTYVDVRSIPEFVNGHPAGAFNVPFMHRTGAGMVANPSFFEVMEKTFSRDSKLVLGCRSGARSLRAATVLVEKGWTEIVDMRGGYLGEQQGGVVTCAGWQPRGLPTSNSPEPGRTWSDLQGES